MIAFALIVTAIAFASSYAMIVGMPPLTATGAVAGANAAGPFMARSTLGLGVSFNQATALTELEFDAVAEIAHASIESPKVFDVANGIHVHCKIDFAALGDDAALDIDIGVVNVLDATTRANLDDATATRLATFHIDGSSANLMVQTDDNVTDTGLVDSGVDVVPGTPIVLDLCIDPDGTARFYADGTLVYTGDIGSTAADFYAFVNMEKTSNDTVAKVIVHEFEVSGGT